MGELDDKIDELKRNIRRGKKRNKEQEEEGIESKRRKTFQQDGNETHPIIQTKSNRNSVSGEERRLSEGSPPLVINPQVSDTPNEHSKLRLEGSPSNLGSGGV